MIPYSNGQRPLPKKECAEFTLLRPSLPVVDDDNNTNGCEVEGHRLYASISESNFVMATAWDYPL
jgi:hypothetical protein